jgi:hypothetical protein
MPATSSAACLCRYTNAVQIVRQGSGFCLRVLVRYEHMFDTVDLHPADPVAAVAAGVTGLAAEDRGHWNGTALSDRLVQLLEVRERFDAEITRLSPHNGTRGGRGKPTEPCHRPRGWRIAARSGVARPTVSSTPPR